MKAIILAGGYATRLGKITTGIPKQLLKVGQKTILEHIIDRVIEMGVIDEICIVTNNLFYTQFLEWEAKSKYTNLTIHILNDGTNSNEERLGAVGDIIYVINAKKIDDDLLVIAGDNLINFSIRQLHNCFMDKDATVIALHDLKDPKLLANRFGTVIINENNLIIDMEEKPKKPKSSLAATMCYLFKRDDLKLIKNYIKKGGKLDNGGDLIIYLIKKNEVYGFVFDELWIDIGTIQAYKEACEQFNDTKQLRWIQEKLKKNDNT